MKRRKAIQTIAVGFAGVATLTHCTSSTSNGSKIGEKSERLIGLISEVILPSKNEKFPTVETRVEFIVNQFEGALTENEIKKFQSGLLILRKQMADSYSKEFDALDSDTQMSIVSNALEQEDDLGYFMSKTRQWSLRHFMTSEHFMTAYLKYEFIPNRHLGCVPV